MDILKKQVLVYDGFGMLFEQAQIAFNKLFNIQQINIDISINDFFLFMQKASL